MNLQEREQLLDEQKQKHMEFERLLQEAFKMKKEAKYEEAIQAYVTLMYLSLSGNISRFDANVSNEVLFKPKFKGFFPYSTSRARCVHSHITATRTCSKKAGLDTDELQALVARTIANVHYSWLRWHVFTQEEAIKIIMLEIEDDPENISRVYRQAKQRDAKEGYTFLGESETICGAE